MEFKELSRKLSPTIRRIAYKLNGRYHTFSHDDLYQEALMHLWSNFTSGKLKSKTDSHILQGCYFHIRNYIRKVNEKPQLSLDAITPFDFDKSKLRDIIIDKCQADFRDLLDTKILAREVRSNGLSFREKIVLDSLSDGLTTREIGMKLSVSHVMVVRIISRIRKKCRKYIE
ncbi:MAG: sigma-70 family RNA polymerase sigma factor [Candidatus Omnitrophica bacterium]|nr:sigma-70 family RNA polymerase sigma factor [Candidatus Omnitrophota bacterium]